VPSRLPQYLRYHYKSQEIGDIDPSYEMLLYICKRFELNVEQRYWLAFLYAMTYCGASTFYVYNEFPDFENVDLNRMQRWWDHEGREKILCQTDRRWVRSKNLFVPAVASYQKWIGGLPQHEAFLRATRGLDAPEARYDVVYSRAKDLHSFGQFTLFLYLEALHTITPMNFAPTDLNLDIATSCRNGLCYAYGLDQWVTEADETTPADGRNQIAESWADLRDKLAGPRTSTVWEIETTLCAYKKFMYGKRYIGSYIDRQAIETAKLTTNVSRGVCWDVLWQFRKETYSSEHLAENTHDIQKMVKSGLSSKWKLNRQANTWTYLEQ